MAGTPPPLTLDTPAPNFRLPGTDGRTYALDAIAGENGTVIVFICNHCPYVKAGCPCGPPFPARTLDKADPAYHRASANLRRR